MRGQSLTPVRCSFCKEEIPLGATLCTRCNRSQDWVLVRCINCKEEIPAEALTCTHCGRSQNMTSVRCKFCKEEIPQGATYCTHCNRYQDWRKYFPLSSTVLSLLTALASLLLALISVLNIVLPKIIAINTPVRSEIHCSLVQWQGSQITLAVSNTGIRPAVVKELRLVPNSIPGSSLTPDTTFQILEPGKYQIITFTNRISGVSSDLPALDSKLRSQGQLILVIFPYASEPNEIRCSNWGA
jgi:Double zinc ribbon